MKLLRLIVMALCLAGVTEAYAQSAIESVIKDFQKSGDVSNSVYTERRNPDTKKLTYISEVIKLTEPQAERIAKAIETERPNAIEYSITNGVITIIFRTDAKRESYTFINRKTLTHEIRFTNSQSSPSTPSNITIH